MGNERFTIPEYLFSPSLIGLNMCGIAEMINASISCLPENIRSVYYSNILLVGGMANLPGLGQRLNVELTALAPSDANIHIYSENVPAFTTWRGASRFSLEADSHFRVTLKDYNEYGHSICHRRFFN